MISATLKGVVAQRLVRRLCPHCKKLCKPEPEEFKIVGTPEIYKAEGCEFCRGTGYSGRIALHEILKIDKDLKNLILQSRDIEKIRTAALKNGLKTLNDDAKEKIRTGLIDFDEARRVLENFV